MNKATDETFVRAVHDVSQGGLAVALAEMCLANMLGAEVTLPENMKALSPTEQLFSESNSRFIAEIQAGEESRFERILRGFECVKIGKVEGNSISIRDCNDKHLIRASVESCDFAWKNGFPHNASSLS